MAIIDHFRRRGAMVVATTHFDALKTYASTTEGVTSAGFGFDPQTFAPTYRLNYGSPGSSLALEIATRLGLPATSSSRRARSARRARRSSPSTWRRSSARCRRSNTSTGWRRASGRRLRRTPPSCSARAGTARTARRRCKRKLDQRIEERLRDARREIDAVVDALKARTDALAAEAERRMAPRLVSTGDIGAARVGSARRDRSHRQASASDGPSRRPESVGGSGRTRTGAVGRRSRARRRVWTRRGRAGAPRSRGGSGRAREADASAGRRAARAHAGCSDGRSAVAGARQRRYGSRASGSLTETERDRQRMPTRRSRGSRDSWTKRMRERAEDRSGSSMVTAPASSAARSLSSCASHAYVSQLRSGARQPGRRRGHGGGAEGIDVAHRRMRSSPRPSSTT